MPTVTSVINPTTGNVAPNVNANSSSTLGLVGTGFTGAVSVTLVPVGGGGGIAVGAFQVNSDTSITIETSSPLTVGTTYDIVVSLGIGGSATSPADQVKAIDVPVATVTGVAPNRGPLAGGSTILITGTGFIGTTGAIGGVTALNIGGTAIDDYMVVNDTTITATIPASGAAGGQHITAVNTTGTSATSGADLYTYLSYLPVLRSPSSVVLKSGPGSLAQCTISGVILNDLDYSVDGEMKVTKDFNGAPLAFMFTGDMITLVIRGKRSQDPLGVDNEPSRGDSFTVVAAGNSNILGLSFSVSKYAEKWENDDTVSCECTLIHGVANAVG